MKLIRSYHLKFNHAKERLVAANLRLVVSIAKNIITAAYPSLT